ncbi:MAG: agnC6, partial [Acidimicrobiaceae bacterium]|nr:agnC6 [Acidimicrobiaceae bacterium]
LVRLAASLLEAGDVLVLPRPVLRVVFPQRPAERPRSPAHQDHLGMQGTVDALTFWFPLVHCTREMGTVAVAVGSQRAGVRPYVARPGARVFSCDDRDLGESWVTTDFAPGDLCVFRSLTVHKALPNSSAHVRLSIDARYQRASEPVGELSVREDDDLSWETVYRGWGPDAPRYGWRRPGVRVVPYDPTYHTTHEPLVPAEL